MTTQRATQTSVRSLSDQVLSSGRRQNVTVAADPRLCQVSVMRRVSK